MAQQNFPDNILYEMDNLEILRGMNSETIDLIATDPPYNTKRNRSGTAGFYVDNWKWGDTQTLPDQWKWNEVHPIWLEEIRDTHPALYEVIEAAQHSHSDDIAAFLCFLSVRLIEMHRILKPTGSLYLQCDNTANAYIRLCLDAVFGAQNFRNEIIWKRTNAVKKSSSGYSLQHDVLFYYVKSDKAVFNGATKTPEAKAYKPFTHDDNDGRGPYQTVALSNKTNNGGYANGQVSEWRGVTARWIHSLETRERWWSEGLIHKTPTGYRRKDYLSDLLARGVAVSSLWTDEDVPPMVGGNKEYVSSPDQKPLALYERIIKASSNEGDIVLDPFAGCATTPVAAKNLNRRFVGIDRRQDFIYHVYSRMVGADVSKDKAEYAPGSDERQWWMEQALASGVKYSKEAPVRTDDVIDMPDLPKVYSVKPASMTRKQMMGILTEKYGVVCWGCGFEPPSVDYLDLDHVSPISEGGSNELHNRAVLCSPCNRSKSNTKTLTALRRENSKAGKWYGSAPVDKRIDLRAAREWAAQYLRDLAGNSDRVFI